MASRHWVGDTDSDWNDAGNWASSSGGAGGAGVPGTADDVTLDVGSAVNCTIDVGFNPDILTFVITSGYAGTFDQNGEAMTISSSVTINDAASTVTMDGIVTLDGGGIISSTVALGSSLIFDNAASSWTMSGTVTSAAITITAANSIASGKLSSTGDLTLTDTGVIGSSQMEMVGTSGTLTGPGRSTAGEFFFNRNGATFTVSGTVIIQGDFRLTSAFRIDGGLLQINGRMTLSDSSVQGTCAVEWVGSVNKDLIPSSNGKLPDGTFTVSGSGTLTLFSTGFLNLNGASQALVVTGTLDIGTGSLTVAGAVTVSGTGTLDMGTGAVNISGTVTMAAAGATLTATSGTWTNSGALVITAGTFDSNGGTFVQDVQSSVDFGNSGSFNNLTITKTTGGATVLTVTSGFTCTGDIIVDCNDADGYSVTAAAGRIITLQGDFTIQSSLGTPVFGDVNITLTMTGGVARILTQSAGTFNATLIINKTVGIVVSLTTNFDLALATADCTITAGTMNLAGFTLDVGDVFTITDTLRLKGDEVVTYTTLVNTAGTVEYLDAAVTAVFNNLGLTFFDIIMLKGKTYQGTIATTLVWTGTVSFTGAGTITLESTVADTQFLLNSTADQPWDADIEVQDSDASPGTTQNALLSTDNGNNINWIFPDGPGDHDEDQYTLPEYIATHVIP